MNDYENSSEPKKAKVGENVADIELGLVEGCDGYDHISRKSSSSSLRSSHSSSSSNGHAKHKKHKRKHQKAVVFESQQPDGGGRNSFWIACVMIVAFFIISGIMVYKFFSYTSFSMNSSSSHKRSSTKYHSTTWSGDFTGEYKAELFSGQWSGKSDTKSIFSLAYRLAESEDKISIEKGPRAYDSYTVYITERSLNSGPSSYTFSEGKPFKKSRTQDNAGYVRVTIKIKGSEWKEKHEGRPKVEIKREFTDSAMKVTYTVDGAVYVKQFEKL